MAGLSTENQNRLHVTYNSTRLLTLILIHNSLYVIVSRAAQKFPHLDYRIKCFHSYVIKHVDLSVVF